MKEMVLALDQGTTGSTAAFFDAGSGELLANVKVEFPQVYPAPGLVEHNPEEIWSSMVKAIAQAIAKLVASYPDRGLRQVCAIGITNQRETVVPWDRVGGEVAGNAIVWQDRRTAQFCNSLKRDRSTQRLILRRTGLVCDPYFSASKMRWLLREGDKVRALAKRGRLLLGTVDSFLLYRLTGGCTCATDDTNASRTMLYNLTNGGYDDSLLSLFGVPRSALPEIQPSASAFGVTRGVPGLPDGIPITGCIGDQQAALYGHGVTRAGEGKITYGTGAFLLVHTGARAPINTDGLLTTVAFSSTGKRTFALEGSAFIAGAAVQYLRDNLKIITRSDQVESFALRAPRDANVLFVPALAGLGAPYWNPNAKGVLLGLTRGTSNEQIARAVLESIALQNVQLLTIMGETLGRKISRLGVDGGAAKSDYLMQFQADTARVSLVRHATTEITALGAAKAALCGLGAPLPADAAGAHRFAPTMRAREAQDIVQAWCRAAAWVDTFYRDALPPRRRLR